MRLVFYFLCLSLIINVTNARASLRRSSNTRNPQCSPEITDYSEDFANISYIFVLDHTFSEKNVDKLKYLMKAMSCEISSSEQFKLSILHLYNQRNIFSKSVHSANFTDLLDDAAAKDMKVDSEKTICQRLEASLTNMTTDSTSYYRFVVPLDTIVENCSLTNTFRNVFGKLHYRNQIHADTIEFGKVKTGNYEPIVTIDWSAIDVNVKRLSKSNVFTSISISGALMESISEWVHRTYNKDDPNNVFNNWIPNLETSTVFSQTSNSLPIASFPTIVDNVKSSKNITIIPKGINLSTSESEISKYAGIKSKPLVFTIVDDKTMQQLRPKNESEKLEKTTTGDSVNDGNLEIHKSDEVSFNSNENVPTSGHNESMVSQIDNQLFVQNYSSSNSSLLSIRDIIQFMNIFVPNNENEMLTVDGIMNSEEGSFRFGWREYLIILGILVLLFLLCCCCRYRKNKKTEYYVTNPATLPLLSTQSSHDDTALPMRVETRMNNNEKIDRTQTSQNSVCSTQIASHSQQTQLDPYSPPINFIADIRYEDLQVSPPVSLEVFASERKPMKNVDELKSLRISH